MLMYYDKNENEKQWFFLSVIICPLDILLFFLDIMMQDSIIIFNSDKQKVVIEKVETN